MKTLFSLLFITSITLFADGFWTLSGTKNLKTYVQNNISEISPKTIGVIKEQMEHKIKVHGINYNGVDGGTMMIMLNSIKGEDYFYVHIKLAVGEEVMTRREGKVETFALTYEDSDFIETDELDTDILESTEMLIDQYMELYEEDKE